MNTDSSSTEDSWITPLQGHFTGLHDQLLICLKRLEATTQPKEE